MSETGSEKEVTVGVIEILMVRVIAIVVEGESGRRKKLPRKERERDRNKGGDRLRLGMRAKAGLLDLEYARDRRAQMHTGM